MSDNGMSIDRTIVEIDEQLQAWNSALFKIDAQLEGALEKVDMSLAQFERAVQTVQGDAANIRDQVVDTASKFPSNAVYISVLLLIDLLIWLLVAALIYQIVNMYRNRYDTSANFERQLEGRPPIVRRILKETGDEIRKIHRTTTENPIRIDILDQQQHSSHGKRPPPPPYHANHIFLAKDANGDGTLLPLYETRKDENGFTATTYGYEIS